MFGTTASRPRRTVALAGFAFVLVFATSVAVASPGSAGAIARPGATEAVGPYGNSLDSMSCPNSAFCMAVGSVNGFFNLNDRILEGVLTEEWNGSAWSPVETPDPAMQGFNVGVGSAFSSVSCTSATFCAAVGGTYWTQLGWTLAEIWNGSGWSIAPTADPAQPSALGGVSCTSSTFCVAVGSSASRGDPGGVQPLGEEWDGSAWTQLTIPVPAGVNDTDLNQIDCLSETFCVAVGSYTDTSNSIYTLIEEFDGTNWTVETAPYPAGDLDSLLADVSCTSDTSCVAVGQGFSDVLNGTTWSLESVPNGSGTTQDYLTGVACVSASFCTTVGTYENAAAMTVPQAATWDGVSWSFENTAALTKNKTAGLGDVACFSSSSCLAVGSHTVKRQAATALLEQEAGSTWGQLPATTVAPLTLSPDAGGPGTHVTVSENGFSPNSAIRVTYYADVQGNWTASLCKGTTDAYGSFVCASTIPRSSAGARGTHVVIARDGDSLEAVTQFTLQ